jgi:hypothetical protein
MEEQRHLTKFIRPPMMYLYFNGLPPDGGRGRYTPWPTGSVDPRRIPTALRQATTRS